MHGYAMDSEQLQKRLKRAEGQVRGIARMIENDSYCIDIATQVSAVQAALDKVSIDILKQHAAHCLTEAASNEERQQKATELLNLVERMVKR